MKSSQSSGNKRSGLVRPLPLALALAGVIGTLAALFPGQQRLNNLSRQRQSDPLSGVYLQVLLRTHPGDIELRRTLARNLTAAGKWDEARNTVAPLLERRGEDGTLARLEALEIDFSMMKSLPRTSGKRDAIGAGIADRIARLRMETAAPATLMRLAEIGNEMNLPDAAAAVYQTLATADPGKRQAWLNLAAEKFLAADSPLRAAHVYEDAAKAMQGDETAWRKYLLQALDTYLSANAGKEALRLAETSMPRFTGDAGFLRRAVAIASMQNDMIRAQQWGRQLLALTPGDTAILSQQVDIEIAAGDLASALQLQGSLLALSPEDIGQHARLARIADWSGRQELALRHWATLARRMPSGEAMDRALLIAAAREDDRLWLELAALAMQKREMKPHELDTLRKILNRNKEAERLVAFLREYTKRYPQREQAIALAQAQEKQGDVNGAIATWQRITPRFVGPVESARRQAELLLRAQKPDDGWLALQHARALAAPGDADYWLTFGNLAWQRGSMSDALSAYRTLWDAGAAQVLAAERLIDIYNEKGEPKQAIAIGKEAARRLGGARWLLLAMDAAARASRWEDLRELLTFAQRNERQFADSAMYWLLTAHLAVHDGQKPAARNAYLRALSVDPASASTRVQLLWFEIDNGDKEELERRLRQWQADAQAQPLYWRTYAAGLLRLKRVDESFVWFEKATRAEPDDYLWISGYADGLARSGRIEQAHRLRSAILPKLKTMLAANGDTKPADKTLLLVHATLAREVEGAAAGEQALQDMLARGYDDADVYEALVASCLSQKKFDAARNWLQRAAAAHRRLPAYQRLAVALEQDDRPAIAELLSQYEKDLSAADRVTALRRLGRNTQALSLTEKSLREEGEQAGELLRQHHDQLKLQLAHSIEAGHEQRNLADLHIARSEAALSLPREAGRLTLRVAHIGLRADGNALLAPGFRSENDVSLLTELAAGSDPLRITVGRNQRRDTSLTYGRLEWTHRIASLLSARVALSVNGLTEETSALRVMGSEDRLGVTFAGNPTSSTYALASLAAQRFHTRGGDALGHGYRVEGEWGATIFDKDPALTMRVAGSWEENRPRDLPPPGLSGMLLPPAATVENVLSRRFKTVGAGATLRHGRPDEPGRPYATFDGWIGRQWPLNDIAYSARVAAGTRLFGPDQIRFEAFYTNVQGGISVHANRGLGIWYRYLY